MVEPPSMESAQRLRGGVTAPIAIGELIDKISILEIKAERIADHAKLHNIKAELQLLNAIRSAAALDTPDMEPFVEELKRSMRPCGTRKTKFANWRPGRILVPASSHWRAASI
ncbi:MAG: hypothetical protein WBD71_05525 [Xanthobacteraceae bacterium]